MMRTTLIVRGPFSPSSRPFARRLIDNDRQGGDRAGMRSGALATRPPNRLPFGCRYACPIGLGNELVTGDDAGIDDLHAVLRCQRMLKRVNTSAADQ